MKSALYRELVRKIVGGTLKKKFPGLNKEALRQSAEIIAINVHARMYGANVDGVESPLWRDNEPDVTATELLKDVPK